MRWARGRSGFLAACSWAPSLRTASIKWGRRAGPFSWRVAAAAAKSLQSCPTLCDPIDGSPPGSPVPGILQARTLEWVAISFANACKWKVKGKALSRVWLSATPRPAAHQAPPALGFSRREHWSGVPLPSPHGVLGRLNKTAVEKSQPLALMNARYYPVPLPRRPGTVSSPDGTLSCPRGQLLICFSQNELFGAKACCFLPRSQWVVVVLLLPNHVTCSPKCPVHYHCSQSVCTSLAKTSFLHWSKVGGTPENHS